MDYYASCCNMSSPTFAVIFDKCQHIEETRLISRYPENATLVHIFCDLHPELDQKRFGVRCIGSSTMTAEGGFEIDWRLTLKDIALFQIKSLHFKCVSLDETEVVKDGSGETSAAAKSAFDVLMGSANARALPSPKHSSSGMQSGLNRKDGLYNDVIQYLREKGADFPKATAESEGAYFAQVLTNALWMVTSHHITVNDRAKKHRDVLPIPSAFEEFAGYNDFKRKKTKAGQLDRSSLTVHADILFTVCSKPYMKSTAGLRLVASDVKELAECFSAYARFLSEQSKSTADNSSRNHPVRTVDEHCTVEARGAAKFDVKKPYTVLDSAVRAAGLNNPFVFNEHEHLSEPFASSCERHRFWENIELSVPIDILRFCPGGPVVTTFCVSQTVPNRSENELLTQAARMVEKMRPELKECHTRAMRKKFKESVKNVATIQPCVLDFLYAQLALDRSAASHPETQHRLRRMFLGEDGLIADLRHLNPGRPSGYFDVFFEKLNAQIEAISAADDRRHGCAHLSEWISIRDMIEKAAADCPPGTPIPSKSLVRLQFVPTNPYTKAALSFTSKLPVQRKIQRRQLRAQHIDDHYCAALFRYLKHKTVELQGQGSLYCCDDKAKVKVGEPGNPVSTGVRGKESITPVNTTLAALDHDMTKSTLTPSVVLQVSLKPENPSVDDSFVRGKVTTAINDTVFQPSSPFRHAAMIAKIAERDGVPRILLKYTDGGTDQRNTLESVKCANICLFREFSLDMLVSVRCAPGQSYINPAERVMSLLNLGLQNCATERDLMDETSEKLVKNCNSTSQIRNCATRHPELKQQWTQSLEAVKGQVGNRFRRLKLKDEPVSVIDPVSDEDVNILQRHLRELFPRLDLTKLQKQHTQKCADYVMWKGKHCRETQYTFQVRKCSDENCCPASPQGFIDTTWLPEPILGPSGEHYLPYEEVKHRETTEKDRPSLKKASSKTAIKTVSTFTPTAPVASTSTGSGSTCPTGACPPAASCETSKSSTNINFMSAQTARATAECVECRKPRVVYANKKMSQRQQVLLALALSEYEYSCGADLFPPSSSSTLKELTIRPGLTCSAPIELPYYGSELGRKDLCCYCASEGAHVDPQLKERFKTVLPICSSCEKEKLPITQRPFGKKK